MAENPLNQEQVKVFLLTENCFHPTLPKLLPVVEKISACFGVEQHTDTQ